MEDLQLKEYAQFAVQRCSKSENNSNEKHYYLMFFHHFLYSL